MSRRVRDVLWLIALVAAVALATLRWHAWMEETRLRSVRDAPNRIHVNMTFRYGGHEPRCNRFDIRGLERGAHWTEDVENGGGGLFHTEGSMDGADWPALIRGLVDHHVWELTDSASDDLTSYTVVIDNGQEKHTATFGDDASPADQGFIRYVCADTMVGQLLIRPTDDMKP